MDLNELSRKLSPQSGMLVLAADTLGDAFGAFLTTYYAGGPITITEAELGAPQPDGAIVYTGKSTFGNIPDLPVTARFSVDATGAASVELRYALRSAVAEVNPWVFSRSFPKLPVEYSHRTRQYKVMLDTLDLYDTSFVVVTSAGKDRVLDVPLSPDINFVSRLRPSGILGAFEYSAGRNTQTLIYGVIIPPRQGDYIVDLKPNEHPWDRLGSTQTPAPPGIYLRAALDLGFKAGNLSLRNTYLRTYTPISTDWMNEHPGFCHVQAFTATLAIPSAQIEVDLSAEVELGLPVAILNGQCSGITLGKLDHMLDFAGGDGLLGCVPSELQKPIEALEKLELMQVGLDIVLSGGLPAVRSVSFTIGFSSLKWHVWADDLVIESLSCRFVIFEPFSATPRTTASASKFSLPFMATVSGTLMIEGVPVSVTASSEDHFMVSARTLAPANLPLDKLVKKHANGVPVPSALTVNDLEVYAWFGKAYSMSALLAGDPTPWTIDVGKQKLVISNVSLYFSKPANGALTGTFSGTLEFLKGVTLQMTYDIPGDLLIRSTLPRTRLSSVIDSLCNKPVKLPKGLDLEMEYASLLIREQSAQKTFLLQLCAQIKGLGVLAFETRKASDGTWGFAYGIELLSQPSQIAGLSALAAIEKRLNLRKFMLVVSSLDQPGFQLPDTAQFNNPSLATKKVSLPGSGGVTAGLNIFAEWNLDAKDKQHKLLKSLLGLGDTLQVTMQVGENPADSSKLFFGSSGKLQGHPFNYKVGMMLTKGEPSLFLAGSVTVGIQKQPVTFDVTTLFVPNGAFMSATMKSPKPIDCGPFKLGNVGLEIGVNLAGLPSFGVTGTIDVKNFESSIAVFFDSADPSKSLVSGSISDLTLKDVVDTLLGGKQSSSIDDVLKSIAISGTNPFTISGDLADELDNMELDKISAAFQSAAKIQIPSNSAQILLCANKRGESWHLTDLTKMRHYALKKKDKQIEVTLEAQFYFAPQATSIGSIAFPQGFYINGAVDILGFHAQATIDITENRGVSVDAEMDKLSIGGDGVFSMTAAKGNGGPQLSISTMAQPSHPIAEYRQPHIYINGAVQLFGIRASALASVTTKEMSLDIKGPLAPGVEFDLDVVCGGSSLSVDGDVKAGIGTIDLGALGKIKVNTDIEASIGIRVSGQDIALVAEASFDFLGEEQKLSKFKLDAKPDTLQKLGETLTHKVEAFLRDEFKDANKWANAMKNGAVDGVEDAEKVLTKVYGKSEKEAKEAVKDIGKGVKSAEKAVSKTANKFGKKLKKLF